MLELALPFGGNLSSPKFSFGQVVRQAVVRAIRGAVLSPLNALGRVFVRDGRIEELALDPIPFSPWRTRARPAGSRPVGPGAEGPVLAPRPRAHPEPPLTAEQRERLQALIGVLPWPGEQLPQLADDRSAAVAAALFLEGRLDPDRVRVEPSPPLVPEQLAPLAGVALEIAGG